MRDGPHREELGLGRILVQRLPELPMTVFVLEERLELVGGSHLEEALARRLAELGL